MRISIPIEKDEHGRYLIPTPKSELFNPALEKLKDYRGTVTIALDTNKTTSEGKLFECKVWFKWGGIAICDYNYAWGFPKIIASDNCNIISKSYNNLMYNYELSNPWQVDGIDAVDKPFYVPSLESEASKKLRIAGFNQEEIDSILSYLRDNDKVI